MGTLDRTRPFGVVSGIASHKYEQDGKYFDKDGNEVDEKGNILSVIVAQPEPIIENQEGMNTIEKMRDTINITLDRDLWDRLSAFAHKQSVLSKRRFSTIHALRLAIRTFLRMEPREINETLKRDIPEGE